jgi:hypothetical protein
MRPERTGNIRSEGVLTTFAETTGQYQAWAMQFIGKITI